jgi:hypothetical protein
MVARFFTNVNRTNAGGTSTLQDTDDLCSFISDYFENTASKIIYTPDEAMLDVKSKHSVLFYFSKQLNPFQVPFLTIYLLLIQALK